MKKFFNKPMVKYLLPLLGTGGSAALLGLMHPATLSFAVGGVVLHVVLKFSKK
jgi:hypothetical protein